MKMFQTVEEAREFLMDHNVQFCSILIEGFGEVQAIRRSYHHHLACVAGRLMKPWQKTLFEEQNGRLSVLWMLA